MKTTWTAAIAALTLTIPAWANSTSSSTSQNQTSNGNPSLNDTGAGMNTSDTSNQNGSASANHMNNGSVNTRDAGSASVDRSSTGTSGTASASSSSSDNDKTTLVQAINSQPKKFLGKKVSVQGEVVRKSADGRSFVIDSQGVLNDRILVLTAKKKSKKKSGTEGSNADQQGNAAQIQQNDNVKVTGTVENLTVQEFRSKYDADLDAEISAEWTASMPVIVTDAQSVQPSGMRAH